MDRIRNLRIPTLAAAFAAVMLLAPAGASAQSQPAMPPEVQEWIQEIQEAQAQLQPLQAQALEDAELKAEQEQVVEALRNRMFAADPENETRLARMEAIMQEAAAAQQTGDNEKLAELTTEASTLQPRIEAAQAEALAHPDVQPRVAAFQENLNRRVVAIDPEAQALIDRVAELQQRLNDAMNGRG